MAWAAAAGAVSALPLTAAVAPLTAAVAPVAATAAPQADAFDRAFATRGEPPALHFTARYQDARGAHTLEVWRQGDALRRRTDDAIDLYAERRGADGLELDVLDHRRRIATRVSREALYKAGRGVDWFALAHGLAKPRSGSTVHRLASAPAGESVAGCSWLQIDQGARQHAVCWNTALRLPARIVDLSTGRTVWSLLSADAGPVAAGIFDRERPGYLRVDADADIQAD